MRYAELALGLHVRDETVRELTAAEHVTIAEAFRHVLSEKLARQTATHGERWRAWHEIQARVAALPGLRPGFTDKDLYDENGLPVL